MKTFSSLKDKQIGNIFNSSQKNFNLTILLKKQQNEKKTILQSVQRDLEPF